MGDVDAARVTAETSESYSSERGRRSWWSGYLGDLMAALAVLLGGGLSGGLLGFFGPWGGPGSRNSPPPFPAPGGTPVMPDLPAGVHLAMVFALVLPAALMLLRRRWPVPVLVGAFVVFALAVVFGLPAIGPGIALAIAGYACASRVPRRTAFVVVTAAAVLLLLLGFIMTAWESLEPQVLQTAAALAIASALGDSARSRREYLLAVEDRALRAEQNREIEAQRRVSEERLRIARDLHDTVAHQISVINLHAGAASGHLREQPERAQQSLATIRAAAREALGEIGGLLHYLREGETDTAAAPQQGLERLDGLFERMRDAGLDLEVELQGALEEVGGSAATVVYRVVQEGLTNARKHGDGTARLRIEVAAEELVLSIANPVAGRAVGEPAGWRGSGLGLVGIRERVAVLRGTVVAQRVGDGFELSVALPIHAKKGGEA